MMHDTELQRIVLESQGLRFNALSRGPADGELVLFLHGFPQFADAWLDTMGAVAGAGFQAVAVDQRGYSPCARPSEVADYAIERLISDVVGFADALGSKHFHVVGHDWGAMVAWEFAAAHPTQLLSVSALSTPHPGALLKAIANDEDQKLRSKYITLFRMPGGAAEAALQADDHQRLRQAYQGKVPETAVCENIRRLAEPGALTAALNWYRALDLGRRTGKIRVPTLYVWGSMDQALGETAAFGTVEHVTAPYRFEKLEGKSHWLLEEVPDEVSALILEHLVANGEHKRHIRHSR
jgi:pimeloyl-ACP methyl ester carboxylesterase